MERRWNVFGLLFLLSQQAVKMRSDLSFKLAGVKAAIAPCCFGAASQVLS